MYLPGECYNNKIRRTDLQSNRGKRVKKAAGNCYSQFPDIEIHECRAVLFETDGRAIANNEETD